MTSRAPAPSSEGPVRGSRRFHTPASQEPAVATLPYGNGRTVRDLRPGESAVLAVPEVDAAQRLRLAELGVREGEIVRVLQRSIGGARVLVVHNSRLAIDAGTARRLRVQP